MTSLRLNGRTTEFTPRTGERLSESLRERLDCRDVKIGCNAGDCGACTVLVDGDPLCACLMPAAAAEGCDVDTLSGLIKADQDTKALAQSFQDHHAAQCGICTPGMMVAATALLRHTPEPSEKQVMDGLGGVLCRCTGYRRIIDAVMKSGSERTGESGRVGSSIRRLDGQAKVNGSEAFGDDIAPPETLVIRIIRAPYAHAEFDIGDCAALLATPGIEAILTADDILGLNRFGVIPGFIDQPVFAEGKARFRGEAVAAVIGTPEKMAIFDPVDFPVTWAKCTEAASNEVALKAAPLHPERDSNIMCEGLVQCGDADAALAHSHIRVAAHFETSFVEHGYIEPEAGFAQMQDGRIVIHACTQAPVMDQEALALIMDRPKSDIRIIPTGVGGGFGSKIDISVQPFLALATLKTGKPVRITYSRSESMQSTTKRHPASIDLEVGADRDGKLTGIKFFGQFNTGAYASWGPTVANRVPIHASGPYFLRDYQAKSQAIYTNCPPSGAFRGFGVPQSAVAQESLFDELAMALGIDPLEFRIKNALENQMPTVCGQVFSQGVGIKECLEALRPAFDHAQRACAAFNATSRDVKRGVGVAAGWYGCGNTSLPNPSTIKSGVTQTGQIVLHQGAMDIGQGATTVITQIFAQALGVSVSDIVLKSADTDITPDAGKTSASRQTFISGEAARRSGEALRHAILARVNASQDAVISSGPDGLEVLERGQTHRVSLAQLEPDANGYALSAIETYDPPTEPLDANGQGEPYAQYGYAAHLAEVEVDTSLGTVKPLRFVAAHDLGLAINPALVEGQVQGGIAQGLGMALMEEYLPGRTENLHDYLIPTIGDIPPVETLIIEDPDAHGPFGAKGLGEHVLIPTAPALLNAIASATGKRLRHLPVTPSRLHAALQTDT